MFLYTSIENASRYCHYNGSWDNYTNYDQCQHLSNSSSVQEFEFDVELPTFIYGAGYILSLVALSLALIVFVYFK